MLTVRLSLVVFAFGAIAGLAQDVPTEPPTPALPAATTQPAQQPVVPAEDKRIFGVLPNNRTTENSIPFQKLTFGQKMTIAAKDSFDYPVYPTAAAFAGLYQLENQNPSWGQGLKGYARRFAAAYGDQTIGNLMTEGLVPGITHIDPRYFRLGEGKFKHRLWYSVTQIFSAKTDRGTRTFNFAEWGGNASAVAISNLYYPSDTRNAEDNAEKLLIACGTDAFSNVLKEFWPDVKRHFRKKKSQTGD